MLRKSENKRMKHKVKVKIAMVKQKLKLICLKVSKKEGEVDYSGWQGKDP